MNLSIIIVSYNTKKLLRQCLRSLMANSEWRMGYGEIIIIDNGSTDGSREEIKNLKLPARNRYAQSVAGGKMKNCNLKLKIILNKTNLGFARANNQGIKIAQGEYILLLNPDIEVKKSALKTLLKFTQKHPEAGIIGGRLLNPDGTIQGSCFHRLTILNTIKEFWLGEKGAFEKYAPKITKSIEVESVVGACMFIPRKVIDQVGFFDEQYFLYFEDLDYCRRVRKAGFKIYYLPQVKFVHHHGASGKKIPRKTRQWLIESSKIYHGNFKHYFINSIIWLGLKWQKILKIK